MMTLDYEVKEMNLEKACMFFFFLLLNKKLS